MLYTNMFRFAADGCTRLPEPSRLEKVVEDVVEGRDSVGGDERPIVVDAVELADLPRCKVLCQKGAWAHRASLAVDLCWDRSHDIEVRAVRHHARPALGELISDILVAIWIAIWVVVGMAVHSAVAAIANFGGDVETGANCIRGLIRPRGLYVSKVPSRGDALSSPRRFGRRHSLATSQVRARS